MEAFLFGTSFLLTTAGYRIAYLYLGDAFRKKGHVELPVAPLAISFMVSEAVIMATVPYAGLAVPFKTLLSVFEGKPDSEILGDTLSVVESIAAGAALSIFVSTVVYMLSSRKLD